MSDERSRYGDTAEYADPYGMILDHVAHIKEQVEEFKDKQAGPFIVLELRNITAALDGVVTELRENNRALYAITRAIRRHGGMNAEEEKEFINKTGATVDEIAAQQKANEDALAEGTKPPTS